MTDKLSDWLRDKISMGELPDTEEMSDAVFTAEALEQQVRGLERVVTAAKAAFLLDPEPMTMHNMEMAKREFIRELQYHIMRKQQEALAKEGNTR